MTTIKAATMLAIAALLLPGHAPAGDKSQSTFTFPAVPSGAPLPALTGPTAPHFAIGTSKGKTKGDDKCKVQIQLSKLSGLPDSDQIPGTGDEVICVSHASIVLSGTTPLSTSAVFRGEVKSGGVKIKVDLFAEGVGCIPSGGGGPGISQYESSTACYAPDPGYPAPPLPFASDATQGVYPAGFGPRPSTPLFAADGITFLP